MLTCIYIENSDIVELEKKTENPELEESTNTSTVTPKGNFNHLHLLTRWLLTYILIEKCDIVESEKKSKISQFKESTTTEANKFWRNMYSGKELLQIGKRVSKKKKSKSALKTAYFHLISKFFSLFLYKILYNTN